MIKEAIEALLERGQRSVHTHLIESAVPHGTYSFVHKVEPTQYGAKLGEVIEPFRPAKLEVSTLTGFVDAIKGGVCGDKGNRVIHVEDYLTVSVKSATCDEYGKRDTLLVAKYKPSGAFAFEQYYNDPQKFIIAFQAGFYISDPDGPYLIRIASNLSAQSSIHAADDGINQVVTMKAGEIKTLEHNLKPRVKLLPRTTFDEVAPVEREFLIRLRQTADQTPSIALHAVDGTKWEGENMRAIKDYLGGQLTDWTILA